MGRYVYDGVRPDDGEYIFDFRYNLPQDIIELTPPQLYASAINSRIYVQGLGFIKAENRFYSLYQRNR